jgi:4-hydroxy-tetrahydrodipicolinate synthase
MASGALRRREFLGTTAAAVLGAAFWRCSAGSSPKESFERFQGIFPIVQTPYTDDGKVDFEILAKEAAFLDKTGVHGIVWPQRASQYQHLSFEERIEGAETIVKAAKGLRPAVVIGVQGPDTETAVRYARHAEKSQPDAIIALPTRDDGEFDLNEVAAYYKAIGKACGLPLFVQTTGNMSVEFVLQMARDIPTLRFVKDEAGNPLVRLEEFAAGDKAKTLRVFTGSHGRNLPDEMMRGVAGNMPAASWADLYVKVWDGWRAGRRKEALETFSKLLLFVSQTTAYGFAAMHYVLHLRGVFPNWRARGDVPPLDDLAREALRETFEFVKPEFSV